LGKMTKLRNQMIKDFVKTKRFLYATVLVIGLAIVYVLGILSAALRTMVYSLVDLDFTPSSAFLSDVAAFEAVVIAVAMPLSFEIVSRISERYQSEVISRKFMQHWIIRFLPIFLIINIILAVALRFFVKSNATSLTWKILAWTAFGGFVTIAVIFIFGFIPRLRRYMTDSDAVLEELFDEADKSLK